VPVAQSQAQMMRAVPAALALAALLAACGVQPARPVSAPPPQITRPAAAPPPPRPQAQVQRLPGLEGVIGADARTLIDLFGSPRLDLREGDARKLQFTGEPCVLDIYLYPPDRGGTPRATYVSARRASDGREVDQASCVEALRRR
jgi:hypothetical protein